ncbi:MAG: response regulator [Leptolyngbyaceae cyanobacterium SU_3_3]|nr:response regulator [Leptolyngbyaceae cyanobacterium SU_3_3]
MRTIAADPLRLKQMLFNLLANGLKFTPRGTVGLQVCQVGEWLNFTVWDTGTGISEAQQPLLFRPYTQLTNAVRGEGTGLGLALTQKLAELHGGWIKVQSQVGQGSRFTIGLPLAKEDTSPIEPPSRSSAPILPPQSAQPSPLGSKTATLIQAASTPQSFTLPVQDKRLSATRAYNILLVEDNAHNARLLITYLCKLGYEVTWAKNSLEMWQALKQSVPALILLDIHMPGDNGLDLTQQLQAQESYRSIPVIVQTAMAMKGDRERCLEAGATDYISKPLDLSVLAKLVEKYSGMESHQPTRRND